MTIKPLHPSLGRILNVNNGEAKGVGLLVSPHYVLTCAHVVCSALGFDSIPVNAPQTEICLDFPFLKGISCKAHIIDWQPQHDIALLAPIQPLPEEAQPYHLANCDPFVLKGHVYTVIGFPKGYTKDGVSSCGHIKEVVANDLVQLLGEDGFPIKPGFSGAPVWDNTLEQVVGMIVTVERQIETKTAFMISAKTILSNFLRLLPVNRLPKPTMLPPEHYARECLRDLFDYQTFKSFCIAFFPKFFRNLGNINDRNTMIDEFIIYCTNENCFNKLWNYLEQEKPTIYKKHYERWEKAYSQNCK